MSRTRISGVYRLALGRVLQRIDAPTAVQRIHDPIQDSLIIRITGSSKDLWTNAVIHPQGSQQHFAVDTLQRLKPSRFKISQPLQLACGRRIDLKTFSGATGMAIDTLNRPPTCQCERLAEEWIDALLIIADAQRLTALGRQRNILSTTNKKNFDGCCEKNGYCRSFIHQHPLAACAAVIHCRIAVYSGDVLSSTFGCAGSGGTALWLPVEVG